MGLFPMIGEHHIEVLGFTQGNPARATNLDGHVRQGKGLKKRQDGHAQAGHQREHQVDLRGLHLQAKGPDHQGQQQQHATLHGQAGVEKNERRGQAGRPTAAQAFPTGEVFGKKGVVQPAQVHAGTATPRMMPSTRDSARTPL